MLFNIESKGFKRLIYIYLDICLKSKDGSRYLGIIFELSIVNPNAL